MHYGQQDTWFQLGAVAANFTGETFALTFTSTNEERFTTIPINLDGDGTTAAVTAGYIKSALEALPNGVIDSVQVDVAYDDDGTSITGTDPDTDPSFEVDDDMCDVVAIVTFDGAQVRLAHPACGRQEARAWG